MNSRLSILAVGHATSVLLSTSFLVCIGLGMLLPEIQMYRAWQLLLPGFEWLSLTSVLIGLIESYAYGWYIALIWVPAYNLLAHRRLRENSNSVPPRV